MAEYEIQQKATIWYKVNVEANSPEEAIEKVQNGELTSEEQDSWWQVLDSTEFLDEFWEESVGLYPKEENNG
jgi:hypothetical protein